MARLLKALKAMSKRFMHQPLKVFSKRRRRSGRISPRSPCLDDHADDDEEDDTRPRKRRRGVGFDDSASDDPAWSQSPPQLQSPPRLAPTDPAIPLVNLDRMLLLAIAEYLHPSSLSRLRLTCKILYSDFRGSRLDLSRSALSINHWLSMLALTQRWIDGAGPPGLMRFGEAWDVEGMRGKHFHLFSA